MHVDVSALSQQLQVNNHFSKSLRVRKRYEFLRFFHQSDVKKLDTCIIFRIPNSFSIPRLGITVKAKANSVYRNKIKRQIREHFRLNRKKFKPADYNIVVPSHVKITYKTGQRVRKNLENLLSEEHV